MKKLNRKYFRMMIGAHDKVDYLSCDIIIITW